MIAGELERLTRVPRDDRDLRRARRRSATINRVWEGVVGVPVVEGKRGNPPRQRAGVGGSQFQGHVSLAGNPRQHLRARDPLATVELRRRQAASFVGLLHRRLPGIVGQPQLGRRHRWREVAVEPRLVDVVEEGEELVILLLRERIELVVVAAAALERQAEEGGPEGRDTVVDVIDAILLLNASPLRLLLMEPIEGGGEDLLVAGIGEEIPGELPGDEIVPGEIAVKGPDHPVAPPPHRSIAIDLEAVAIGVARQIEPVGRHPLAVARALKEPIEEFFIRLGAVVADKRRHLFRGRRQPCDIKRRPTDERNPIGLGLRRDAALRKPLPHDSVDRMNRRQSLRQHRNFERLKRPVGLVFGAGADPAFQELDLLRREPAELRGRRRHDDVGIIGNNPRDHFARRRIAWHDRLGPTGRLGRRALGAIQPQPSLTVTTVGPVALKAGVGKDRPDVAIKRNRRLGSGSTCRRHQDRQQGGDHPER